MKKKADRFYKSRLWLDVREQALRRDHYWCQSCNSRPATIVHHKIPRKVRPELELDLDNLESVCDVCHNRDHPEKGRHGAAAPRKKELPVGIRVVTIK